MLKFIDGSNPVRDEHPDISSAKAWIGRLGGSPVRQHCFAASPVLAVGHYRFDGLAEEVEADGEIRRLSKGGGYQLFGRVPYRLRNVGKTVAVVACACTPPII